jgi:thiamine kinase-like enzyme
VASIHKETMFHIYRPNTGLQQKQETIQEIKKSYEKVCKIFCIFCHRDLIMANIS